MRLNNSGPVAIESSMPMKGSAHGQPIVWPSRPVAAWAASEAMRKVAKEAVAAMTVSEIRDGRFPHIASLMPGTRSRGSMRLVPVLRGAGVDLQRHRERDRRQRRVFHHAR